MITQEQLNRYFSRIGIDPVTTPNLKTLTLLQESHAHTFPFENLNPLLDIPVRLDADSLFSKFVVDGRGGYCYEQNILFMEVLKALGYTVRGLSGRVVSGGQKIGRRTHMLLLIELEGYNYITDVGFGSSASCVPLLLETNLVQESAFGAYRIVESEDELVMQSEYDGKWRSLYHFDLQRQNHADFEVGNWYTSTYPGGNFRENLSMSIRAEGCRHTLNNNLFKTYYYNGNSEVRKLKTKEEVIEVLTETFKIKLGGLPGLSLRLEGLLE